jgi:hypothetical protein
LDDLPGQVIFNFKEHNFKTKYGLRKEYYIRYIMEKLGKLETRNECEQRDRQLFTNLFHLVCKPYLNTPIYLSFEFQKNFENFFKSFLFKTNELDIKDLYSHITNYFKTTLPQFESFVEITIVLYDVNERK